MSGRPPSIDELVQSLSDLADDETEAEAIARKILQHGSTGVGVLVHALRAASGKQPKLAVAVLNAIRAVSDREVLEGFAGLLDETSLAVEDRTYLLTILSKGPVDAEIKRKTLRELGRTHDPVERSEVLVQIVRLHVDGATETLRNMAAQITPDRLDYRKDPERAMREEMVLFALAALEGEYGKLQEITFDPESHTSRRTAALEFLSSGMGSEAGEILRRAMVDPSRVLRGVAVGIVGRLRLVTAMDVMEQAFGDPDPWVVHKAVYAVTDLMTDTAFSTDIDSVRRIHAAVLKALRTREASDDRTDRQILVPSLLRVSDLLGALAKSA